MLFVLICRNIFLFRLRSVSSHIFKVTRDAEIDIDNDISYSIIQKIEKGLKNRKKGKPVRFVYDQEMDPGLLEYLIRRLNLSKRDNLIPAAAFIISATSWIFLNRFLKKKASDKNHLIIHYCKKHSVTDVVMKKDMMLHFPYHSFSPLIDLIREAAIDPDVTTIKITCYRLASQSKIINALINAVRNGKQVMVMLELRARFDEEANLEWKERLEEEGAKVLIGIPDMKVHAKICLIRKRVNDKNVQYGFVSTGNLNERTARIYGDHCLLTSNTRNNGGCNRIFNYLETSQDSELNILKDCTIVIPKPANSADKEMYEAD